MPGGVRLRRRRRGAMRRPSWRGSRGGGLPSERAGEGGTDERDQEHGHEAGDDAQPLRPAKPATWFSSSFRRTGPKASAPAHSKSPFRVVTGGGIALRSQLKGLILRRTVRFSVLGGRFRRYPGGVAAYGPGGRRHPATRVPPHNRERQRRLRRFPVAGPGRVAVDRGFRSCCLRIRLVSGVRTGRHPAPGCDAPHSGCVPFAGVSGRPDPGRERVCNCKHHGARLAI